MAIDIPIKIILTYGAELAPGWGAFVTIPNPLPVTAGEVPILFSLRNGSERFEPESMQNVRLANRHVPFSHKSRPIDRLFKACRTSNGFSGLDAKALAKWIALEPTLQPIYRPSGFEFEREPRFGLTLSIGDFRATWHGKEADLNGSLLKMENAKQSA